MTASLRSTRKKPAAPAAFVIVDADGHLARKTRFDTYTEASQYLWERSLHGCRVVSDDDFSDDEPSED